MLDRLGLEGCFHGVICFETLNSPTSYNEEGEQNQAVISSLDCVDQNELEGANINHTVNKTTGFAKIVCKPSLEAFETAIRIANINPEKTVRF